MLGQIQVTPRWLDDNVLRQVGGGGFGVEGGCPPPGRKLGGRKSGRGGSSKQVYNN